MQTTDDAGGAGRRRQDTEGRRRAEQKLHECVLEMMELPETAVSQATVHFPERLLDMDVGQHKAALDSARDEWNTRLAAAMDERRQNMPLRVRELADTRATRARQSKRKSVRTTARRAEKQRANVRNVNK